MYEYTIEYCEVALRAYQNGFINKKIQNFIDNKVLEEVQRRINSGDKSDDKFARAAKILYSEMYMIKHYHERVKLYLKKLGINNKPYEVLYSKKVECPSKKYVCITKVYEDDSWTYEEFYGSGKSETAEEFINEFEILYKNTGVELRGCDGPYETPPCTMYYYDKIYTVFKKEE